MIYNIFFTISLIATVVGLICPTIFLKADSKAPRLKILAVGLVLIIIFSNLAKPYNEARKAEKQEADSVCKVQEDSAYNAEHPQPKEGWEPIMTGDESAPSVFFDRPNMKVVSIEGPDTMTCSADEFFAKLYKSMFDTIYNKLVATDKGGECDRKGYNRRLNQLLYEDWWNFMMSIDSTQKSIPTNKKTRDKAIKLADAQYAKYLKYGNENPVDVRVSARLLAQKGLKPNLHDPKSLKIEERDIRYTETSQGLKCTVPYRAKNMFGAYVLNTITFTMRWDDEGNRYYCYR